MSNTVPVLLIQLLPVLFFGTASPASLLPDQPFVTVWNAPTSRCLEKYGVDLDLAVFDIVANENQSFAGAGMVIFYSNQLGLYPYYNTLDEPINGGLPQNVSLKDHLNLAYKDMEATIVSPDFKGVAVIDWEAWRPLWYRNWDTKSIYKDYSLQLVKEMHPDWSGEKLLKAAIMEFEKAAEKFMASTLELGCKYKPGGLWGFYGFPACYNYGYKNGSYNYTGECPPVEVERNDMLKWMWKASRALYPDIYLEEKLKMSKYVGRFVKHRLEEAFRVSAQGMEGDLPVLPYARIVYTYSMDFLQHDDLVQTIGQSAALGATGVILWGNADYSSSKFALSTQSALNLSNAAHLTFPDGDYGGVMKLTLQHDPFHLVPNALLLRFQLSVNMESCLAVKSYIDGALGMYVVNVTSSAALCSQSLCTSNGRCVRRDSSSEAHLHLPPDSFSIMKNPRGRGFLVSGQAAKADILHLAAHFTCRCYVGWSGADCSQKTSR